ncbi:polymorphic toxin-type HINT domain-containing protein [Streptomyces avicenniae]|uniref:polymorphic toxin-type HINT domain-containing protein n=1 Tax=Streptomyces avicenniae TaxID=500153 RepID=UPI00069A2541|nr:polymorphic toxin-type HINT domain-containing protein [Streptomyces avicenniae]
MNTGAYRRVGLPRRLAQPLRSHVTGVVTTALLLALLPSVAVIAVADDGSGRPGLPASETVIEGDRGDVRPRPVDPALEERLPAPSADWPEAGTAELTTQADGPAARNAGQPPVRLISPPGAARSMADAEATTSARLEILDRRAAERVGIDGLLFSLSGTAAARTPSTTQRAGMGVGVELDYSSFAQAYGGGYGARLGLVSLPACALTTPDTPRCRQQTPLGFLNDTEARTLVTSESVDLSGGPTVLAAVAEDSGPTGDYAATELSPSGTWEVSLNSGDFTWSYELPVPDVPGGLTPTVGLGYSSGSIDGRTSATNNQSSWVGDGFNLWPGYIERSYHSCADEGLKRGGVDVPDLCWAYDNATLSMGGTAGDLISVGDNLWRLRNDDGTRIERFADTARSSGDADGEYWKVTTPDGTQYHFGYNRLPGWTSGRPETESVWNVPVYGNNTGEPCRAATFVTSWCQQAWRWNLDYVVDPRGNVITYFYDQEDNSYGRYLEAADDTPYVRGGVLKNINYGLRSDAVFARPSAQVVFTTGERCLPAEGVTCAVGDIGDLPSPWYDTPWDLNCAAGTECDEGRLSPTFWSRYRLSSITTQNLNESGTYTPIDTWDLTYRWGRADIDWTLLPTSLRRTGRAVTPAIELPATEFVYEQGANRLDEAGDGVAPFIKHRLSTVTDEFGGQTDINYSSPACDPAALPTLQSNTSRCFPQYWTPPGAEDPEQEWFNKYVVTEVVASDRTGGAPEMYTRYSYLGGAAWHYDDDDGLTEPEHKTWSQWRGYGQVRVRTGGPEGMTTQADHYFLRGMDGDRAGPGGGEREVAVDDGQGGTITDHEAHAGYPYRTVAYSGPDGVVLEKTLSVPWRHQTATRTRSWGTVTANFTGTATERAFVSLDDGAGQRWRETRIDTTYDTVAGRVTRTADLGDVAETGDDRCTTTAYADNPAANILDLPARTREWTGACTSEPTTAERVVSDIRTLYDDQAFGAAPTRGDPTGVQTIDGLSGGTPSYRTAASTFDAYGRVLTVTDHAGRTTTTGYTPTTGRPAEVTVTTPPAVVGDATTTQITRTQYDTVRGVARRIIDTRGLATHLTFDALGRLSRVRLPGTSTEGTADYAYTYRVAENKITAIGTTTLLGIGTKTDWTLYDGLLRPRQTQSVGPDGGRLLTDTRYDNRGQSAHTYAAYYTTGGPQPELFDPDQPGNIESQTAFAYDGLGRVTTERQLSGNSDGTTTEWARAGYTYGGDRVNLDPMDGGIATTTITDVHGRTTELRQYRGATPTGEHDVTRYRYNARGELIRAEDPAGNEWTWEYDILGRLRTTEDPDAGTTVRTYNERDELVSTTDARAETVHHTYDNIGRRTALREGSANGRLMASWVWDTVAEGQLTSSTRHTADGARYTTRFESYDDRNRPIGTSVIVPSVPGEEALSGTYTSGTEYNRDNTPRSIGYPTAGDLPGTTLTPLYDGIRRVTGLTGSNNTSYLSDIRYSLTGKPLQHALTGGAQSTWVTNSYEWGTQRLHDTRVDREDVSGVDRSVTYGYDDIGNVLSIADDSATGTDNQCFRYDYLRRLTEAWAEGDTTCSTAPSDAAMGGVAPYWHSFTYDLVGNRRTETLHEQQTTRTYAYPEPGTAQPHTLTSVTQETPDVTSLQEYGYDDSGNTLTRQVGGETESLTWDAEGHLATVEDANGAVTEYVYDADGNRLLARTPTETIVYLGHTELRLATGATEAQATRYIDLYGGGTAVQENDGTLYLTLPDHHNTGELAIDTGTQQLAQRRTLPFGGPRGAEPAFWPGSRGFVGGIADSTGLTHLGAREYDPALGRFISVDPVLDLTDPQQINGYAYSNNNPTTFTDPTGLKPSRDDIAQKKKHQAAMWMKYLQRAWASRIAALNGGYSSDGDSEERVGELLGGGGDGSRDDRNRGQAQERGSGARGLWGYVRGRIGINEEALEDCSGGNPVGCTAVGLHFVPHPAAQGLARLYGSRTKDTGIPELICGLINSFEVGTEVLMGDGTRKPIEDLAVGDTVVATDPESGETSHRAVTAKIARTGQKHFVTLGVEGQDGAVYTVTATAGHPFWRAGADEWTDAGALVVGDRVRTDTGETVEIVSSAPFSQFATAYNLTVEGIHTYYVLAGETPVLVHNINCPIDVDLALQSGARIDPSDKRGEYTVAGRSLQKHAGRNGNPNGWPIPSGRQNPAAWNTTGQEMLDEILNHPNVTETRGRGRIGGQWQDVIDIRLPNGGLGARFTPEGSFSGFLD